MRRGVGGQKGSPTSFSIVTSTNVGVSPKNIFNFSINPFFQTGVICLYLVAAPNYWDPPKMWFFRSNPYKIEVVITSFIEMQELPNFVHVNTSTI